jgi:hypothetical protein
MSITYHTPETLAGWAAAEEHDPAMAKLRDLTVEYVSAQGGLTLALWRLYMGPWFSNNVMMTLDDAASKLGISDQLALNIVRSTDAVIIPRWRRTPEFVGASLAGSSPMPGESAAADITGAR